MKLRNQNGFSLMEVMIGAALTLVVGLSVSSLLQKTNDLKRDSESSLDIDQNFNRIENIVSYKPGSSSCENVFSAAGGASNGNITVGPYSANYRINPTTTISNISTIISGPATGKTQVRISVTYQKKTTGNKIRSITKTFVRPVVIDAGNVTCLNFDSSEIASGTLQEVCSEIGGTVNSGACDVDSTTMDSALQDKIKEFACSMFGANFSSGLCDQINVTDEANGANIGEDYLCINGNDCRFEFDNSACASGQYLTGMNTNGQNLCNEVNFIGQGNACIPSCLCGASTPIGSTCDDGCGGTCTGTQVPCSPDCSCAAGVALGGTCTDGCGGTCDGTNCDHLDSYSITGDVHNTDVEWASGTQTCRLTDYPSQAIGGSCSGSSVSTAATAGVCQKIVSGCSGSTPPTVADVADGLDCGGGNICQAGSCVAPPPSSDCLPATYTWGPYTQDPGAKPTGPASLQKCRGMRLSTASDSVYKYVSNSGVKCDGGSGDAGDPSRIHKVDDICMYVGEITLKCVGGNPVVDNTKPNTCHLTESLGQL